MYIRNFIGGEMTNHLFSMSPSRENHRSPNSFCSEYYLGHPSCILECGCCNSGFKNSPNCITHGTNFKKPLKFEPEQLANHKEEFPNNNINGVSANTNKKMHRSSSSKSNTPTLHHVKVSPDPKGLPVLNNIG